MGIGATVRVKRVLMCTVVVMHFVLRRFYNFDRMAFPVSIGMLHLSFSHCVHCTVETTHFVDAGCRNSQFFFQQ